ncbi:TnsA-like heteromeric transposase endonuclease subunit [Microbacterium sp. 10M-3C3]|uniref:TnsA-like heteromeric transposase endonuclease subunit n=1 Tax=Microbacterium sp. 10M-3C3 TaxID=2483401 RepID=UPI0013DDDAA8|nr:TnsA-like heteromeric transposase endonuclease subunit [Microbacterium sp. 10M-3C3]
MQPVDVVRQIAARRRSPHTEVHWIPRTRGRIADGRSGRQEYAIAGRILGEWDWAAIDPMQVRTSKGVRHYFTGAMYFWQGTRSHVWCESQAERWEVLWLDYGGQVERLWAQPMAIVFGHRSPLAGRGHVPDFLAQFTDGSYGLFDVRPAERVDARARVQFDETAEVCNTLGWHYQVLTGHDPLATQNLDCLSASRHDRCRPAPAVERVILDAARGGRTRGELCRIASPACPPVACAWVDNLAWRRLLHVDLGATFNSDTVYSTVERVLGQEEAA